MFVYLTYCTVNGKSYIGKYEGSEKDEYLGSGKLLSRAISKYGRDNFKRIILERFQNRKDCNKGEKKWIDLFDAVESKMFYNIAKGGDGGNTYAGLSEEDKIQLKVRLKDRKKRTFFKKQVAYLDLLTKKTGTCTVEDFNQDRFKVGIKSKNLYITPIGIFSSVKVVNRITGIDMKSLQRRCVYNDTVITLRYISGSEHKLKQHDLNFLGKSFKEAGYGILTLEEVLKWDITKIKNLNIIKNE